MKNTNIGLALSLWSLSPGIHHKYHLRIHVNLRYCLKSPGPSSKELSSNPTQNSPGIQPVSPEHCDMTHTPLETATTKVAKLGLLGIPVRIPLREQA